MNKFKKGLLATLAVCTVVAASVGFAACGKKSSDYPDYINPGNIKPDAPVTKPVDDYTYAIKVQSFGGLSLNNVKVSVKKDGATVVQGISLEGMIYLNVEKDVYSLEIDEKSLPAGYYLPEGATFATNETDKDVVISLPSKVIESTAEAGKAYSIGSVMYDFSFTDTDKTRQTLSEILSTKKAVILNFWYRDCNPCKSEFPALQTAYEAYSDRLEIIALSPYDSITEIAEFREEYGLSFLMGEEQAGMTGSSGLFGVQSYPTTIVIDRYGVIAERHEGSIVNPKTWTSMFNKYCADDYVQNVTDDDGSGNESADKVKPDVSMPDSAAIAAAVNGEGTDGKIDVYTGATNEEDKEYSWPFLIGKDNVKSSYIYASNTGIGNSFAILETKLHLKSGDILSYDYNIKNDGSDGLYVILDNQELACYSDDSDGWKTEDAAFIATRDMTVNFSLLYMKYSDFKAEDEIAAIANIRIVNAKDATDPIDFQTSAVQVDGENLVYSSVEKDADGIYRIMENGKPGPVLLADILNPTLWSDRVIGNRTLQEAGESFDAGLYYISYWMYSNWQNASAENGNPLKFDFDTDGETTEAIIDNFYWQEYSKNGYIPVTDRVKDMIDTFIKYYCEQNGKTYDEKMWMQMCYYTKHYGDEHPAGEECEKDLNPIKGFAKDFPLTLEANGAATANIDVALNINGGGVYYLYTPEKSGVYHFYSTPEEGKICDPAFSIHDKVSGKTLAYNDEDEGLNCLDPKRTGYGFNSYVYLEGGKEYYLQAMMHTPGDTGTYKFNIEYVGETYEHMRVATTGEGMWTWATEDMSMTDLYYIAIDTMLAEDGYYYEAKEDGSQGGKVYIDFVHYNYCTSTGYTPLSKLIEQGYFDLTEVGGPDYTQAMTAYFEKAKEGKQPTDELYGIIEANDELVNMICELLRLKAEETKETGYWKAFAVYCKVYGAEN